MKTLYPFNSEITKILYDEIAVLVLGNKLPENVDTRLLKHVHTEFKSDKRIVKEYNVLYEKVIGLGRLN